MTACGESPMLLESLSPWKQMKTTINHYSFTEIFGILYIKGNHVHDPPPDHLPTSSSLFPPSSSNSADANPPFPAPKIDENGEGKQYRRRDSSSSSKSLCTEGLGSESSDDVEDLLKNENCNNNHDWQPQEERKTSRTRAECDTKKSITKNIREFPPPISCIGRNGKPWVCFKTFRQDGRFILKEMRIPTQEFLHACRENGRLKLQLIQSDDEISEDDEEDADEESDDINRDGEGQGEGENGD